MKRFNDLKIGIRILIGFFIIVLIAGLIGGIGIYNLRQVNQSYQMSYGDSVDVLGQLEEMSNSFQRSRMNTYGLVLAESPADKSFYLERMQHFDGLLDGGIEAYAKVLAAYDKDEIKDILVYLDKLTEGTKEYYAVRDRLVQNLAMDPELRMAAYRELKDGALREAALAVDDAILNVIKYENEFAHDEIDRNLVLANRAVLAVVGILVGGAVVAFIIAAYLARNISVKIAGLVDVADRISAGDLSVQVKVESRDEVGMLASSFQKMTETLAAIIGDLRGGLGALSEGDFSAKSEVPEAYIGDYKPIMEAMYRMISRVSETLNEINVAAEQVTVGSEQVASGAQALATGSTQQAASVEELNASVETIAGQADENTRVVADASAAIDEAENNTRAGNEHMQQLSAAMSEITAISEEIASITKVIEDIAFQTNILALNAAIEAARAGEAGKGFAVVADEVRNLAAKSAEAAHQTGELIQSSVVAVNRGAVITDETAGILEKIGVSAEEVTKSFDVIESSLAEQTHAIDEIKDGLNQISSVVQTNAATAEENSATSEEMSAQALALQSEILKFTLADEFRQKTSRNLLPLSASPDMPHQAELTTGELMLGDPMDMGKY